MTQRAQFSLADLMIAVLTAAICAGISLPLLRGRIFPRFPDQSELYTLVIMLVVGATALGALTLMNRAQWQGRRRWTVYALAVGILWAWSLGLGVSQSERRVAYNEQMAVRACQAYDHAQALFATDHGRWAQSQTELQGYLSPEFAAAFGDHGEARPYHGYRFVLTWLPWKARVADRDVNMHPPGVPLLLAYPAEYGRSGVRCFRIGPGGIIFHADLGANTHSTVADPEQLGQAVFRIEEQ